MAQYDDIICFIGFADAQKITNLQNNQITNFEIMLNDVTLSPKISKQLETYLGYPYFTSTVYEMHRSIFSWIELQKEPIPIILGLIIIIAAFNIVTTLLILVIEKVRSIAVLRALGINRSDIVKIFVKLGISLGLWGSLIGTSITLVFSILQKNFELIRLNGDIYFLDVLPVEIIPMHYVIVIAVSFLLSFIATLIPAIIASRLNPLQAFRFK
jgi:lipoprotein-releasing system permease protein